MALPSLKDIFSPPPNDPSLAHETAFDFAFESIHGMHLPLSSFKGKALLVVNTASQCSFTVQYNGLRELYDKYRARGFEVVGVPSNDFNQEPANNKEVEKFCKVQYLVNFPLTGKCCVKGKNAHPFFKWARMQGGWLSAPKWNFHKYLIAPDGSLAAWYFSSTPPLSGRIARTLEKCLPQ